MSDQIKHECAVTLLRLRKKPEFYGDTFYGFRKMLLLLEKQHNRGQDGAGIAGIKIDQEPGYPAFQLEKSARRMALADLIERIGVLSGTRHQEKYRHSPFAGELFLGHLRYGTFGSRGEESCHPFARVSSCLNRTMLLAGNFNLANTGEIFEKLLKTGHHPSGRQDGALILNLIGHYLEQSLQQNSGPTDFAEVLKRAAENFDGAFTLCGALADGNSFVLRDAAGIRPAWYYCDENLVVAASERPAIQTAFELFPDQVKELPPGSALIVRRDGQVELTECLKPVTPLRRCVFERIYFSRGNDSDIHRERKAMGQALLPDILKNLDDGIENAFFSYIPNTAQISFHGMLDALMKMQLNKPLRFGQIAVKDAKFRTFIADAAARDDFTMHVYDVTYGLVRPNLDTLVVIDDSIVRGSTMRRAILPILDRLSPRKIVIASAAPPICYPDCYGIDMGSLQELVAFEALVDLLKKHGKFDLLTEQTKKAEKMLKQDSRKCRNPLKKLYAEFSFDELTEAIKERLRPPGLKAELALVFQRCDALRACCPDHLGDWYFTGDYPTPGGYRMVNRALANYVENIKERAY